MMSTRAMAVAVLLALCIAAATATETELPKTKSGRHYPPWAAIAKEAVAPEMSSMFGSSGSSHCTVENEAYDCKVNNMACLPNPNGDGTSMCQPCRTDSDCHLAEQVCVKAAGMMQCKHKPLWKPDWRDVLGAVLISVGGALAAGGGIGGGGVFVPILIFIFYFREHSAVALSSSMVFGGSLANFMMNVFKRHPFAHRPLIDYDVVMVMEPLTLTGSVVGVFLNILLPDYLIVFLLVFVLSLTTWRSAMKGIEVYRKESQPATQMILENERRENKADKLPSALNSLDAPMLVDADDDDDIEGEALLERGPERFEPAIQKIFKDESTQLPIMKIIVTFLCWGIILSASLLKGGSSQIWFLHLKPCTWYFFAVTAFSMVFTVGVTIYYTVVLLRNYTTKVEMGYPFARGDIKWTKRNSITFPAMYAAAGIMAGTLGIGGGMIKGPLMLEMGMIPETTAATAAFMIMFTSSSTTVQYLLVGTLRLDYAVMLGILGFISTVFGQLVINYLVKKYKKSAFIIFSIVFVIGTSTVLLGVNGGLKVYHEFQAGTANVWGDICSNASK